ncbi:hypothetical protein E0K83_04010 [Gramella sp. BOM4]|nr:hypothetical protein [Christiangramia bathymodioli]
MSKRITDEQLNVEMSINGVNKTQSEISKVQKSIRGLKNENEDLAAAKRKLLAEGKRESDQYKELTKKQRENRVEIDKLEKKSRDLQKTLGLTGMTMRQLEKNQKSLRSQMKQFVPNTPEWDKLNRELKETDKRLNSVRKEMGQTAGVMGRMQKTFGGFGSLFIGGFSIGAVLQGGKKLLGMNAELSDSQANVQKTTGLTNKQVELLTKNLKTFDTRTPVNELLALAEEAGRLGKDSVEDVMGFVKTADMIRVALGDDLQGDINENVQLIGKLSTQYKVADKFGDGFGRGMERIGSAINEVASSGANQAGFLVDYLKRLVGVSSQANISAEQQLGFAAALDEAGQSVEVSGTTMSKIIVDMYSKADEYAKIAGMSTEEFSALLKEDANEALLTFLEGLEGNGEGLEQMTKKMDGLNLEGARSVAVLTTLAANTDTIRAKQEVANKAIAEGTSLTQEFNVKNANLAGNLEKIGNAIGNYFRNSALTNWLTEATSGLLELNRETNAQSNLLREQQFQMNIMVNSITSLNEGNDARSRLLKELNKNYPDLLKNLDTEKVTNEQLRDRLIEVNDQYREKIKLAAFGEMQADNQAEAIKLQREEEERIISIEKNRVAMNIRKGKTLEDQLEIFKKEAEYGNIAKGAALGAEKDYNRILAIRERINELEKENLDIEQKKSQIDLGEDTQKTEPDKPTGDEEPITPEVDEEALKKAKAEAERRRKEYESTENYLLNLIRTKQNEREVAKLEGLDRELALIDTYYNKEIEKAAGHADRIKELELLKQAEKQEATAALKKEYEDRTLSIEEENRRLREEAELERELAKAETQQEKDELKLEYARSLALRELEILKEAEIAKVEAVEGSEKLIAAIREKYRLQADKMNRQFDKQEKEAKDQQVTWTKMTEQQKLDFTRSHLASAAEAFNEGSESWKAAKIAETTISTYQAAQSAFQGFVSVIPGPIGIALGTAAAAAAVSAGIKRVGTIASTDIEKIPQPSRQNVRGYEKGKYPDYLDVTRTDGKRFRARNMGKAGTRIVNEPSYFSDNGGYLAAENGTEMIIDNAVFRQLNPKVINSIIETRNRVKGFESGMYPQSATQSAQFGNTDPELKAMLASLMLRLSEPIKTYTVYGYDEEEKRKKLQEEMEQSSNNGKITS